MTLGKSCFIKDENGKPWAYKCTCGKVTSLLQIEQSKLNLRIDEGFCPHCLPKKRTKLKVPLAWLPESLITNLK